MRADLHDTGHNIVSAAFGDKPHEIKGFGGGVLRRPPFEAEVILHGSKAECPGEVPLEDGLDHVGGRRLSFCAGQAKQGDQSIGMIEKDSRGVRQGPAGIPDPDRGNFDGIDRTFGEDGGGPADEGIGDERAAIDVGAWKGHEQTAPGHFSGIEDDVVDLDFHIAANSEMIGGNERGEWFHEGPRCVGIILRGEKT